MGVLLCGNCLEFYERDDWTRDDEGNYEQCRFIHCTKYSESAWNHLKKGIDLIAVHRTLKAHFKMAIPKSQVVWSGRNLDPM